MQIYISETKKIYYEGQKLTRYDLHGEFIEHVKINKFIIHRRKDKSKYICVNIQSLKYKTKNLTINTDDLKYYTEYREWES